MTAPLEDWVTHKELAEFLGITDRALSTYRIPHAALGGQKLYAKPVVADWLAERASNRGRVIRSTRDDLPPETPNEPR